MTDPGRQLYAQDVVRRVLALREDLVRHDENLAAHALMTEAVPYFVKDDPAIVAAQRDQHAMVRHILEPEAYGEYYASNEHERPFEQQYGLSVEDAHRIPRVGQLRLWLHAQTEELGIAAVDLSVLDLSANDGFMAANLAKVGFHTDCIDLHPGNCELAEERREQYPLIGAVVCGDLHEAPKHFERWAYDAVVCFETIEHVADPEQTLAVMCEMVKPEGRLYISTPLEAVEQGNLPSWDRVEPKGHVRVFRERDFKDLLGKFGAIEMFLIGGDQVMVAQVKPSS
jgi:2-polyprenyl-3-methyl-5-hydroxy-6-metoxy-1,4-benzoquinol methylase